MQGSDPCALAPRRLEMRQGDVGLDRMRAATGGIERPLSPSLQVKSISVLMSLPWRPERGIQVYIIGMAYHQIEIGVDVV